MGRCCRASVVAGTVTMLFGASAAFGAGSAVAATASCRDTVPGGEPVILDAGTLPVVGGVLAGQTVSLGTGPAGGGYISGGRIANAVAPLLDAPLSGGALDAIAGQCGITVDPVKQIVEKVQETSKPVTGTVSGVIGAPAPENSPPSGTAAGQSAGQPGAAPAPAAPSAPILNYGPFLPGGYNPGALQRGVYDFGALSLYDYARLFAASPGAFGRLPSSSLFDSARLFGETPNFGILGANGTSAADDVAAAGRAQALPTTADRVALPVLVAVLMLAGVTAALIRNWALLRPDKG